MEPMIRSRFLPVAPIAVGVAVAMAPVLARADCAESPAYQATVNGNTVSVSTDFDSTCPGTTAMLRQDVATGAVVDLASYCGTVEDSGSYVDECVPPGTYRYGLQVPFMCEGCGATAYFAIATVTAALPMSCTRSPGDPGPTTTSTVPAWGTGAEAPQYESCSHGCDCDTATATVVGANSVALGAGVSLVVLARRRRKRT
jgi:hypothetical protein